MDKQVIQIFELADLMSIGYNYIYTICPLSVTTSFYIDNVRNTTNAQTEYSYGEGINIGQKYVIGSKVHYIRLSDYKCAKLFN